MSQSSSRDDEQHSMDHGQQKGGGGGAADGYPSMQKRVLIMMAVYLSVFLVTLDQNIISTAIPRITDEFHSIQDIGWYGSAYLLTMCSFQLLMGKVYKFYPVKPIFLTGIGLFEGGSAVCGSAPTSAAFIVGRAVAGLGASGMFSGMMVIMFHTVPLQQRPIWQGAFGAVFAVASVIGPLIGGALTDNVIWRWCFYINLPIGAVVIIVTIFVLHLPSQKLDARAPGLVGKLKQLDPVGNLVFFPGIFCLILALQWGGTEYSWKDARIIVLLVLCAILCLAFAGIQIWKREDGTVPLRIVQQRSVAAAIWFSFFTGAAMMAIIYYLPIWFQAIKGVDAIRSGIMLLPLVLSTVFASMSSGIIISRVGYYTPFFILSSVVASIGAGLLSTFTSTTEHPKWIGYQVLFGLGLGFGAQQGLNVVQTILERSDIATGSALIMFARFLGSAIFVPVAENIFLNGLVSKLTNLPGISPSAVTQGGATDLRNLASGDDLKTLLADYNHAIVHVFYLIAATCAVTIFGSVFVEWRSLKARASEQASEKAEESKEATESKDVQDL
ncbi:uncharacterized protein Z519_07311 [Cladophialophora bantiana CBS 173.52]|uniref:Major facilitator superfamily (MFS) profile domain-containing protein n=1 Tax=Cladophialophora bantiana (strain ATCC 10958 / CBS 173.52 / CDC B-1940 / NIH 8579) TaxID=1442370 RepID=A0A0D2G0R4_CLAB1|nr:uncharacterized protein Z519_07311 [Cladophialophora bantiana CBS 173.52]KIW92327.1 hypothetical protein Z519_07311 [Cladophialophora bantiana CBS 173.52]